MSVVVKFMKIPESCGLCDLFHAESPMHCTVVKGHKTVGAPYGMPRPEWCPLVALPDTHGDLIDKNALIEKAWDADTRCGYVQVVDKLDIDSAPTVIEAEDEP